METLNPIVKFKEYISLVLLIPTILGGGLQLYELGSISISFIRFFSVSQLLADGILAVYILMIVFILPFAHLLGTYYMDQIKSPLIAYLIYLLTICLVFISISFIINNLNELKFYMIALVLLSILIYIFFKSDFHIKWKLGIILIVFISIIFLSGFIYSKYRELVKLPDNLNNIEVSHQRIKDNFHECNKVELLYFNDKYVFLELTLSDKKIFRVEKFEDYFFN